MRRRAPVYTTTITEYNKNQNGWSRIRSVAKKITRNSSEDEIANVNFFYDDIVHVLQNTIDSCRNSATDRRGGYVLERNVYQIH